MPKLGSSSTCEDKHTSFIIYLFLCCYFDNEHFLLEMYIEIGTLIGPCWVRALHRSYLQRIHHLHMFLLKVGEGKSLLENSESTV